MKPGDLIHVRACKSDGTVYRSWHARIESIDSDLIITTAQAGDYVYDLVRGHYFSKHTLRSYYWVDKFYNLIEIFANGTLTAIYLNIASPPSFEDGDLSFTDYELDVFKRLPEVARLVDEDEFAEAALKYHYTEEFQNDMYAVARQAIELADQWQAGPVPRFGDNHA